MSTIDLDYADHAIEGMRIKLKWRVSAAMKMEAVVKATRLRHRDAAEFKITFDYGPPMFRLVHISPLCDPRTAQFIEDRTVDEAIAYRRKLGEEALRRAHHTHVMHPGDIGMEG